MTPTRPADRTVWFPALLDLAVVSLFVVVGRRSHDDGGAVLGFLRVWWPFAVALGASALLAGAWRQPLVWPRAVAAWAGTVVVGMTVRIGVQGRELKPSFVVVTAVFLAAGMLGWRAVVRRRRVRVAS